MKKFVPYIFLPLMLLVLSAHAQQGGISINGKITAADDQLPIPGTSISIDKKGIGTSTNANGLYALIIPTANQNDSLKISCIGFKTKRMAIAGLSNGQQLNIVLDKNVNELKEVSVAYYDVQKIITKAINRIGDNYIDHPHIIRGFYRMYTYNKDAPLELSEAVFDVYNFGYTDKRADLFRLIKARNEKNERDFSLLELGQKPNSVFEYDVVNHLMASGFLSEKGMEKHTFNVKGIVDIKGYQAYQVDFAEKPNLEGATYRGRFYIDTKTYAFIYFDFGLSPSGLKELGDGTYAKRAMMRLGDVDVDLTRDRTKVSYQEVGSKWVLAGVEGDDNLAVKSEAPKLDYSAHVKFNYQVTSVDTVPTTSFSSKIGRNESISEHDSDAGERFWKDYNILLSDFNTEDIFKQIAAINKSDRAKIK